MGRGGAKKKKADLNELEDEESVPVENFLENADEGSSAEEDAASVSHSSEEGMFLVRLTHGFSLVTI